MKTSAMPDLKFAMRPGLTDAQIIYNLHKLTIQLTNEADKLRDLVDEQRRRIAELEAQLAQAIKTGGVPF